jgi:hypothetical protein
MQSTEARIRLWAVPRLGLPEKFELSPPTLADAREVARRLLECSANYIRVDIQENRTIIESVERNA